MTKRKWLSGAAGGPVEESRLEDSAIQRAASLIREGGLVAFPTETVYGLGANALDESAVEKIYRAKGRPATSPLIVHVATIDQARGLAAEWPPEADALAAAFWPGPLTLVVCKSTAIPDRVTAGLPTVGLRIPSHPVAHALLERAGVPIAAPSANKFMGLSPTEAEHARKAIGLEADLVLEGGASDVGLESTVLSLVAKPPLILRLGMITRVQIAAVVGPVMVADSADAAPDGVAHAAPGMHQRHYSPRTPLIISGTEDTLPSGQVVWVWWNREAKGMGSIRLPADAAGYARELYRALHEADEARADLIVVEAPPEGPEWEAIWDRLHRASSR